MRAEGAASRLLDHRVDLPVRRWGAGWVDPAADPISDRLHLDPERQLPVPVGWDGDVLERVAAVASIFPEVKALLTGLGREGLKAQAVPVRAYPPDPNGDAGATVDDVGQRPAV
jgi:hypothetical protein